MADGNRIARALVVAGLLGFLAWRGWQQGMFPPGGPDHNSATIVLTGTVELERISLATSIGGRVITIAAAEGDPLASGALVLQLEDPLLQSQLPILEAQLAQAQAMEAEVGRAARPEELREARAALAASQARLDLLREGPRPEEVAAAEAQVGVAEAQEADALDAFTRASELYDKGVISAREWEVAHNALLAAQERTQGAREQAGVVREGARPEELDTARALVEQQRAVLDLVAAGSPAEARERASAAVATASAQLEALHVRLAQLEVHAPADGVLDRLLVDVGELVLPNQSLGMMRRLEDVTVLAYLPEPDLAQVRLGQEVTIALQGAQPVSGTIHSIASEAEFTPRNIQTPDERATQVFAMEIAVSNPPDYLRDGMTVSVTIPRKPPAAQ